MTIQGAAVELLTEVESNIDEIKSCLNSFWITDSHREAPVTHAEDIKRYRCRRTRKKIVDLMDQVALLLEFYGGLIPIAAMRPVIGYPATVVWRKLIEDTHCIRDCIDHLIKWFELSDLRVVQDQWQGMANEFDDLIDELDNFPYDNPHQSFKPLQAFIPILNIETQHIVPPGHINPQLALNLVSLFQGPLQILNDFLAHQCADPHTPQDTCQMFIFWYANWQFKFSLAVRCFNTTYRDLHPHHFLAD
ncbi:hypothetical protein VP01_605g7 [Puccinia sorghi]|uniref:Uncharacterized protein n=1 Tax=Puccinia sorghi TaxID=27349 RepID=A0A0L6UJD0_9BASI|nr:hypothetical protein VP01_605g5 [Puccinia sorghi]KNZ47902.1 hypothetical protein VP01_605g7 [Puccinia sorghi]